MANIKTTTEVLGYTLDTYHMFSPNHAVEDDTDIEDFELDFDGYKKDLARLASKVIESAITYPPEVVKQVTYGAVASPREYNFQTDSGDVDVEVDLEKLTQYLIDNRLEFEKYLKDNFTSYDGFWSFVENDWHEFFNKYNGTDEKDKHLHRGVAVGWYMRKELLPINEYLENMWEGYAEAVYENMTDIIYTKESDNE